VISGGGRRKDIKPEGKRNHEEGACRHLSSTKKSRFEIGTVAKKAKEEAEAALVAAQTELLKNQAELALAQAAEAAAKTAALRAATARVAIPVVVPGARARPAGPVRFNGQPAEAGGYTRS